MTPGATAVNAAPFSLPRQDKPSGNRPHRPGIHPESRAQVGAFSQKVGDLFYHPYISRYFAIVTLNSSCVVGGVQVTAFAPACIVLQMLSSVFPPEAMIGTSGKR